MDLFSKACFARIERGILKLVECSQDPFWLLDKFLILAGTRFTPQNRWQRFSWTLYLVLTYFQLSITLMCFLSAIIFEEDSVTVIRTFLAFATFSLSLAKQNVFLQNRDGVFALRNLLETPDFSSGDPDFDESQRMRFKRTSRILIITIVLIIMVQQVLSWIPNTQISIIFNIPKWFTWCWGEIVSLVIHICHLSTLFTIWSYKLYGCTIATVILMVGFKAEQTILAHRFGLLQDGLQELRQSYWDCELARKQYWERLKLLVRVCLERQELLLRHLKEIQSLVQTLFFYIYYTSLLLFGADMFIVSNDPAVFMFVAAGTVLICSLEVFSLCHLMDSQKVVFESISGHMFYLCVRLPYSEDHHKDYMDMRATVQIIAMCSRNAVSFGCAGVSEISVAVFTEMINNCYSVFTFLREMV